MNKSVKFLKDCKLLQFNRDKPAFDVLKYITNTKIEESESKSTIKLWKGSKKFRIKITRKSVRTKGDEDAFKDELKIWEKDCLNEYAVSVRSKKELLSKLLTGEFMRFVLVPVLLEAYNFFDLDLERLCEIINKTPAVKSFLFFKTKKRVNAQCSDNTLCVVFENAQVSVKLKKIKPEPSLLDKNFNLERFQNDSRDAFYAGLIYILKGLNGENFDYSVNGSDSSIEQICRVILESLYKYLMIENV